MDCLHCVGNFVGGSNIERAVLSSQENNDAKDIDALCSRVRRTAVIVCCHL